MDKNKRERIALFRFGVIAPLVGLKKDVRGQTEKLIKQITDREWTIPGSQRSFVSRSAVLSWLKQYAQSGEDLASLCPKPRSDKGRPRSMDKETELSLINLKKELGHQVTLPVFLKIARERKVLPAGFNASFQTLYRLFERHGLNEAQTVSIDRRKFEAELPNDLWQADIMHGPCVVDGKRKKKAFLIAVIDDHSRLITHAEFYLNERLESFLDCFKKAIAKRGLPRKLYLDNGPAFRNHQLKFCLASLGVELVHSKAYVPQGKGKIERWFRTVRMGFLPLIKDSLTLSELNQKLAEWIKTGYESKPHDSTGISPLERFLKKIELVRKAPQNLNDFFRMKLQRKVAHDRTASLNGRLFEAPVELIGKTVTLLVDVDRGGRAEVFFKDKSFGFLVPLDCHINSRIGRNTRRPKEPNGGKDLPPDDPKPPRSGQLF